MALACTVVAAFGASLFGAVSLTLFFEALQDAAILPDLDEVAVGALVVGPRGNRRRSSLILP